ncbi:integrase, catalytic region [Desulfobacula toluolica Tol2]|uniref:Integrase, catalytic region n=1 Tax=Desulfobacula toluolica (strain DSM 7467 / Tol2) TaxID=651182 RepID=K0NC58_DESTT|nr:integrase, catalytic region [Desulfobacula toluolica Tol2]
MGIAFKIQMFYQLVLDFYPNFLSFLNLKLKAGITRQEMPRTPLWNWAVKFVQIWACPLFVLDDHSRLCCHIQWYLNETAEVLIHGLSQAFYKRGLPRSLMTDKGAAMIAHETCNGLIKLGINHETTLPYSSYQNGEQEAF